MAPSWRRCFPPKATEPSERSARPVLTPVATPSVGLALHVSLARVGERARHLPLGALILASASAGLGGLDAADLNRASRTPRPARPAQAARALTATRLARA